MRMQSNRRTLSNSLMKLLALSLGVLWSTASAAQGCVAAHSNQRQVDELLAHAYQDSHADEPNWLHKLTLNVGYRFYNSNKYFIGTQEIARPNAVRNHQNIFDVGMDFKLTPRWSIIADVPIFDGSRNQIYPPSGVFRVAGVGDLTIGAQAWLWRPPTENNGTIGFSASLNIPA